MQHKVLRMSGYTRKTHIPLMAVKCLECGHQSTLALSNASVGDTIDRICPNPYCKMALDEIKEEYKREWRREKEAVRRNAEKLLEEEKTKLKLEWEAELRAKEELERKKNEPVVEQEEPWTLQRVHEVQAKELQASIARHEAAQQEKERKSFISKLDDANTNKIKQYWTLKTIDHLSVKQVQEALNYMR